MIRKDGLMGDRKSVGVGKSDSGDGDLYKRFVGRTRPTAVVRGDVGVPGPDIRPVSAEVRHKSSQRTGTIMKRLVHKFITRWPATCGMLAGIILALVAYQITS